MSNTPLFPQEEGKPHYKQPEFIVIDDRQGKTQYTYFGADSSRKFQDSLQNEGESPSKGPVSLRFLCLLGFIFCLVFGLGILIGSVALTFLAALSLFRKGDLNRRVRSLWKLYTNTVIVGLGFTLGMISPTLGLGLIALYFSIASEVIDNNILRKILKRSFNHF